MKCVYGNESEIKKIFKIPSVVGRTSKNELINDNKVYTYKENHYYVGEDALVLESNKIIDITDYKNLEYFAPLMLHHVIVQLGEKPDMIITGLSKAQIQNSGYFENALKKYLVNNQSYEHNKIYVLPQGAGSKLAIDKYNDNFPNISQTFNSQKSYVAIDIGFNTIDMFEVINGKTSANLFEGIENEGIIKLAKLVKNEVKNKLGLDISLKEAKQVLDTNEFKVRGKITDFNDFNTSIKLSYLSGLNELVESRYGRILDKMDYFYLLGGGR